MGGANRKQPPKDAPVVDEPTPEPVVQYQVNVESLDVGGVVRGLKKGKVLSKKVVAGLEKMKASKMTMFEALLHRKAISIYVPPEPAKDDKKTTTAPSGNE